MIHVADSDPSRCKAADEFLHAGKGVSIGNYSIHLKTSEVAEVYVPTRWAASNQSKETQAEEINEAKRFFRETVSLLPYLGKTLPGLKFSFLIMDDVGNTSFALTEPTTPEKL